MKQICYTLALVFLAASTLFGQSKTEVVNAVWNSAGGKKVWEQSRYIMFEFAPERDGKTVTSRTHLWDRYTGDYRFETKTSDNKSLLVLFNVQNQKGQSFIDGAAVPDSLNAVNLKKAYASFVNDSYWLLVPVKLEDPGVNLELKDAEEVDGKKYNVLHLDFDKVGLTPGDQYWLYIDPATGTINRWKFLLQGQKEPGIFTWTNYKDLGGGLKLATRKQNINQNSAINFPIATVLVSVDPEKFKKQ
ncbi:DUF6503 family protein [Daejeonella oryzae]|uniref:DUF6503 family protein n=1 Tax=Daejeonella oryzae TaxID=1122943 RepID=UPI00040637C8|nr:DUF6503 family protein [Daejeonella oryzae]